MEKRRDSKGRILNTGESQRSDGRYAYKNTDTSGKTQFIYSWKLVATDRLPKGKRGCLSLREKEAGIQRDLSDGIDSRGKKMTLCELYARQNAVRADVRNSTVIGRESLKKALEQDALGMRCIDSIKPSDAHEWAVRMKGKGYAYRTINNYKRSLKAAFYMAMRDDYVRKNPFDFRLGDVIEDDSRQREALTVEQEKALLEFMEKDAAYRKYYNEAVILLNTGLRISELCGLTDSDLDFEKRLVSVDHQLLKDRENGYYVNRPKTKSGIRQIPMTPAAYQAFRNVLGQRGDVQGMEVDGYSGFLFLDRKGRPMTGNQYTNAFKNLVAKYNKNHETKLPNITPHVLRHTFCTRLASRNINPKSLQYLMGHSNISITLQLYTHASIDTIQEELEKMIL